MKGAIEDRSLDSLCTFYKDMHHQVETYVRIYGGDTNVFSIIIGLHQGYTFCWIKEIP